MLSFLLATGRVDKKCWNEN